LANWAANRFCVPSKETPIFIGAELGADKSITNDDGKTPAEVAESRGPETIAALLRE
jgi:hypothetical protein